MKPLSQSDCDRMRRLCEIHPQVVVAQLMHIDPNTVTTIKKRGFVASTGGPDRRPMPDDFPLLRDKMPLQKLARHYQTGLCCIYRWIEEAGGRDFKPRSPARIKAQRPRPARQIVVEAVEKHGPTKAAVVLGVTPNTLHKWRDFYGLPIFRKRVIQLRKRVRDWNWAETYHQRQVA